MSFPNFFVHPLAYNQVRLGGRLLKAVLYEIDGMKIEDEWSEQKPTGSSGATWVFKGTKPAGPHKATFKCARTPKWTAAETYDDLMEVYDMMAPVPGFSGSAGTAASANKPVAYTTGQAPNATQKTIGAGASTAQTPDPSAPSAAEKAIKDVNPPEKEDTKASGSNPGPRPPTLSIENAFFHRVGTTAVSRKSWEIKPSTDKDTVLVTIEFVPQKAPVAAGTGVAPAKTPDAPGKQWTPATSGAADADKAAAEAGAGT